MAYVVTSNCERCRFTDCATTCPVACFHGDAERLYIDPNTCIDCGACVDACPVRAIYDRVDVPDDQQQWIEINTRMATTLPVVDRKQEPLSTALARKAELGF